MSNQIPQLRVRTEFSFRQAFGPVDQVAAALEEIGCPAAAIVDGGTWGHVRWSKALAKHATRPLYGTEVVVPNEEGQKPVAWALAANMRDFYRFSTAARVPEVDVQTLLRERSRHVISFAGAALTDPETFDYVDLNPSSPLALRRSLALAKSSGKPMVLTSDNWYPAQVDLGAFLAIGGRERATPQHIMTLDEMRAAFHSLPKRQFDAAVRNTFDVAERVADALPTAPLIEFPGDLRELTLAGKAERLRLGHLAGWTKEYDDRMERELAMIAEKRFESYFLVVADLISWAKERMLVGPGRGSSAGSLVCYLLRITEIDPLEHDLLFERFIDVTRADLPDIDIDFSDTRRHLVFEYLSEKYGAANVARIGNINRLASRSAIAEVCKRLGIPDKDKFDLYGSLITYTSGDSRYGSGLEDTLTTTAEGRKFMERHPAAKVMQRVEHHAWHTGVHAAGVIVCNIPVSDFCTVGPDGVAQIDKPDSEALNLLKIDALGLRTLGVIEDSGVVTADELYALKLDDPEVFTIFNARKYSGVFQFEGQAQRGVSAEVDINSFRRIDHVTALARPGPLGGGAAQHYINRAAGREAVTFRHPSMASYLGPTLGVVLYQEQVMRIVRELGQFSWAETTVIRKAMSGRKGKEYFDAQGEKFIAGALTVGVKAAEASAIWEEICTFGAWGMNASHTVSYGVISYWCGWMKRYHPLEYAAACLRNAKDDEQTVEVLREMVEEGVQYIPFDPDLSELNWAVKDGKLVGGYMNLHGFGPAKATTAIEARNVGKMTPKLRERISDAKVKFADLYPIRTAYREIYEDPVKFGCREGSKILTWPEFPPGGDVLWIAKVVDKKPRDINEALSVAKRNGKRYSGPTAYVDFRLADDTGTPIIARIDRFDYERIGRVALENLKVGEDIVLVRGRRIPSFSMVKIDRIKCLNRPEALHETT